ncbi:hypothetical protein P9384_02430 [Bacillus pumilus]|uniref:hypothetical protein n=1 Tax=Bacillus pumilus TaxID=1408 RepID=UPI000D02F7D7|nr:hypothetical protein [Bacillus pumilus]MCY7500673.1 hypothetical protein [Bacillus pumilus]MCY7526541.1 hypothetical protein [Bacillus pumilus]MED4439064.1 hypothetical protein [Bacillus pumilus]MED4491457.1 hypothetical protein [Bacillus pumilus]MED4628001.1 hypothetical protein [Bacillus pumilus]
MRFKTILNILIPLSLALLGTFLGDGYKDPLYFYGLIVLLIYAFIIDRINRSKEEVENQLKEAKDQISALIITKNGDYNPGIQCSFYPRISNNQMGVEQNIQIDVLVNSTTFLTSAPEIKLITEKQWNVSSQHQKFEPRKYGGKFEYFLDKPLLQYIDNKHFKYSFDVQFSRADTYLFTMVLNNGQVKHEINNSFKISQQTN